MKKAYLHYTVRWCFEGLPTVLLTHHIASCGDGKQIEHKANLTAAYMRLYDSGITSLVSIDCREVDECEYTLLKQQHMEVI
ncbi:hypothetical protein [Bacillus sp. CCB-MMP212]|uniref:hypothetical protein n=1 Tax=Bacillus sp. CCB-MMP212 TaxID=2928002 RepID=UPI001F60EF46|nr:hypothetical protein [Bacillus sp. CCB-MMP212]